MIIKLDCVNIILIKNKRILKGIDNMEEKKIEELNGFKDLRIVDNFYQTSSFFPMPTTEIGTLSESGQTNLGSYSLCFHTTLLVRIIMQWCYVAEIVQTQQKIF